MVLPRMVFAIWFTYDPSKFKVNPVGTMSLTFIDQDNVTMSYTINGITQSKVITRQPY